MSELKGLVVPFLVGGTIIASVKWASMNIPNPALAAIIGGFPTGLLSIYFVSSQKAASYAHNYFFVVLILLIASMIFYITFTHGKMEKQTAWMIAVLSWIVMVTIRYFIAGKQEEKKD